MKKILVPTDFSLCASKAIDYAVAICKRTEGELIILHACELMDENLENSRSYIQKYNHDIQDEANKKLELLKSSILADNDIHVSTRLYAGPLISTIIYVSKRYNVDLVLMGTHGASGIKQLILGSQTSALISKCEIPVLAIPTDYNFIKKGEILLAVNDVNFTNQELEPFLFMADAFGMNATLLTFTHINQDQSEYIADELVLKQVKEKLLLQGFLGEITTLHITGDNFLQGLQNCVDKLHIDIITMITHKREGFRKIWNKSLTRRMSYLSNVPLLAIPHEELAYLETRQTIDSKFEEDVL